MNYSLPKPLMFPLILIFSFLQAKTRLTQAISCDPSVPKTHIYHHLHSLRLKNRSIPEDHEQNDGSLLSNVTKDFKTYYYHQTLDHFNYRPESYKEFKQRYLVNDKYWGGHKSKSPIFVYLGAEQSIDNDLIGLGWFNSFAPQFNALIVFIEHRYYGRSNPYGPMNLTISSSEDRGYFNSAQALADYAEIILYLKKELKADYCPVIVFGGSYGGMLAAWFRLKYPHVAIGALASSAPILVQVTSPYTYMNWVDKDYRDTSITCHNTIKQSWAEIKRLASRPNGLYVLAKTFKMCSQPDNVEDVKSVLVNKLTSAAQYDAPPRYPVSMVCKAMDETPKGTSILDKIFVGVSQLAKFDKTKNCYDFGVTFNQETIFGWEWQTCSEIIDPDGVSNNTMFEPEGWTIKEYIEDCKICIKAQTRPSWLNTYYGGEGIKLALRNFGSNIIFYNGLRDPFSQSSILESLSNTLLAINAPKGSHCLDLLRPSKKDPNWLVMVRNKEAAVIKEWIAKYHSDLAS